MNMLEHAYLKEAAAYVGRELERALSSWYATSTRQTRGRLDSQLELLVQAAAGGKRLRGTLVQLGYELAGGQNTKEALPAAAAYELLHTGFLIHDDIIDKSPLRRGQPAVHTRGGGGHPAMAQAICLGDAAFFLGLRLIADSQLQSEIKAEVISRFTHIAQDTILGEMLDVSLAAPGSSKRESDVLAIGHLKTAAYTFVGPLTAGAVIGGAPASVLPPLERYGEYVGLAFQLQDDILGVFGEQAATGKSATSDIEENKNTLLIAYALAHAAKEEKSELTAIYGTASITAAQLETVRSIFIATGALEYARSRARAYVTLAKGMIDGITENPGHREILAELAEFSLAREK